MSIENDPYAQAMLGIHKSLIQEIVMLRAAFIADGLQSGRHDHASMADLLEKAGKAFDLYEDSTTKIAVDCLRQGRMPPAFTVIDGGKAE